MGSNVSSSQVFVRHIPTFYCRGPGNVFFLLHRDGVEGAEKNQDHAPSFVFVQHVRILISNCFLIEMGSQRIWLVSLHSFLCCTTRVFCILNKQVIQIKSKYTISYMDNWLSLIIKNKKHQMYAYLLSFHCLLHTLW